MQTATTDSSVRASMLAK